MLAMGDALALVTSRMRGFALEDFARFHPGGDLGRRLSRVEQHMRTRDTCRVAYDSQTVRQVFIELSHPGRRSGAIMLIGASGNLTGLFTDSDLARLFETRRYEALDQPIREVMTKRPRTIAFGSILSEAVTLMAEHKISELPVVDSGGRPVGLIDVTDIVGMIPEEKPGHTAAKSATAIFGIPSDQNAPEIQKHSNRR
jgi:arabinose-5-phosphate isomerase